MDSRQAHVPPQIHTPAFSFNFSTSTGDHHHQQQQQQHKISKDLSSPQPTPVITMNGEEMPVTAEEIGASAPVWATPTSQTISQPPHSSTQEGFQFTSGDGFGTMSAWDASSSMGMQTPSEMSRPVSMHQDFTPYPMTSMGPDSWLSKPVDDSLELHNFEAEMNIGQAFTADEAIPVLDLHYDAPHHTDNDFTHMESHFDPRRISGSSFTLSTTGGLSDVADFSSALSEAPSFMSDYPPPSNRNSMMSSTQLSPVASPRMTPHGRSDLVRTHSRGRGTSPSPRPARSAPYSVDSSSRSKRWSTGSYANTPSRRQSPFFYHQSHIPQGTFGPPLPQQPSRNSSPPMSNPMPLNFGNLQAAQASPFVTSHPPGFRNSMILPSQLPSQGFHPESHPFEPPPPLLSHGLFRMLQSNAEPHSLHGHHHYADLSDPPDLFSALHEEQIPPPPEDMNPDDPDMVPHEQELRFEGDLYTPKWVRGHGNKREGWCGICKPGRWLVLKNSAFWYDKSFTHGISAATGAPFQEPQEYRRTDNNPDLWEGLCGSCNDWIALVSSKKKGTTWFRHAYRCHTHPKVKDAPKRRRESSHTRPALAASQMARPKMTVDPRPVTPQSNASASSVGNTPTSIPMVPPIPAEHAQQVASPLPPMPRDSAHQQALEDFSANMI